MSFKFTIIIGLLACMVTRCVAADWQPAKAPLATRWTKDVSPENVWQEYPRPQMVRSEWTNLNGLWDYAIRPRSDAQPQTWDGKILVPFAVESALSGVARAVTPDQTLWYRRQFSHAPSNGRNRLLLHFGAVDWQCTVWLNGQQVGEHEGGFDPFSIDITDSVHDGNNEIVIAVWDPTDAGTQPRGKQVLNPKGIWYTAVTGIWQTVWLESVPNEYISSLKIVPDVDTSTVLITVNAIGGEGVRIIASDQDGTSEAEGKVGEAIKVKFQKPKLWSPDSPHLYDLKVELLDSGEVADSVESYCALRKIEVRKDDKGINRLFLNNEVLFQYGPLDQGWWPDGLYTPPTDEAIVFDIEMTKKFGMNMARKHTKYEPARWYYWCDKLGLLVWQDMPSGDADKTPESKANYRRELKAMIDTLHNYPSIVMWVPFNEGWGQHDTPEVVAWLEQYDPTRPVNEASGWHDRGSSQMSDMHNYPGPGMRPIEENRAVVLGEFGGLGLPIPGHTWQDQSNWGYVSYKTKDELTDAYVALLDAMRFLIGEGLSAAVYTQTSDVEIEVNGMLTYDRKLEKMDPDQIAAAAKRLYGPPPTLSVLAPTSEKIPQEWSFTTTEPVLDWKKTDFDDSSWQSGQGGFGTEGTPGAVVRTNWDTSDIWLRRSFQIDSLPKDGRLYLRIHHDEDSEVYLNGQLLTEYPKYVNEYVTLPTKDNSMIALRDGKNVLAVHCHQTGGGQYIDIGLEIATEQDQQ
ncbi:glycoside hydrolase family 2 protein [Bythopirellula polymerisocia]|uniref:Beta-galactosidase large subunit n=1 Tax=Bythopirellula polymerisocia TaxID=2528003 RepID=A0A5C6CR67_9BACT|nr:sugar-binding domain-containing protein [Bythopirellula polymerisocia]TWU26054.1 Beta-galactosidase large subunit [Bythopirellula polymerisocia]